MYRNNKIIRLTFSLFFIGILFLHQHVCIAAENMECEVDKDCDTGYECRSKPGGGTRCLLVGSTKSGHFLTFQKSSETNAQRTPIKDSTEERKVDSVKQIVPAENIKQIRLDIKSNKGCKYSEMVSEERLEIRKENKITWTGKCQGEYISGSGTLKILSSNGDKQTINVNFSHGFENGEGESNTETNDSKSKFKGAWINGFRSYGTSVTSYSNGTSLTYTGQFAQGFRNGTGKLVTSNPSTAISFTYIGNFTNNKYDGKGRLEDITSSINYEGLFKNGSFINGKIIYKNGAVYEGDVKNFRPDGIGIFKYPSGETYAGGFVEGMKEGIGELTYSNGSLIYKGSFKNDLMDGRGQFIFNNGDSIEEGYSIKGKRSGEWVIKKLNGDRYYVDFENGIKTKVIPAASNQAEVQKAQVNAQNRNTAVINCQNFTSNQTANRDYSAGGSAGGAVVIGLLAGVQNQAIFDDCIKGYGY